MKGVRSGLVRRISLRWRDERVVMWVSWREARRTSMGDVLFGGGFVMLSVGQRSIAEFGVFCEVMVSRTDKKHLVARCHCLGPRQQHAVSAARLCHFRC